jgi:hypothetical protein
MTGTAFPQVIKGGADPSPRDPSNPRKGIYRMPPNDELKPQKSGISSGGGALDKVLELEKKIKKFNKSLSKRQKKCFGVKNEFKTLTEAISYLNIQLHAADLKAADNQYCEEKHSNHRCLMNRRNSELLKSIGENSTLVHYLINHENLSEENVQHLLQILKKHHGP